MELKECGRTREELISEYNNLDPESRKMLEASYSTVVDTKACADRLEEIREFCRKMDYKKIGIAFCRGLRKYGQFLDDELSKDFEVYSVCCNVSGINKSDIGVVQMDPEAVEVACNPLGEAAALTSNDVDIVIKCGFCLGHDILFSKNIKAPMTTFIVKDRKKGHRTADIFK